MCGGLTRTLIALFALLWEAQGVHDDDCELTHLIHSDTVVDWIEFRELLARRDRPSVEPQLQRLLENPDLAKKQCPLGYAASCLLHATPDNAYSCIAAFSLSQMLASRWPFMEILSELQAITKGNERSCEDLTHPSLDWDDFRGITHAFVASVPPWLQGLAESDAVPEEFNDALAYAQGIVWKGSSAAVTQGRSIADWTGDCELGLLAASAIRAAGVVLSDGDVYRIVQRALEGLQSILRFMDAVIRSPWPLFGLMKTLSLMKRTLHDTRLLPADFAPDDVDVGGETKRSAVWHASAMVMQRAAGKGNMIMLTALPKHRVNFFQPFLKHAGRLEILSHTVVAPLQENHTETCESISQEFVSSKHPEVPDGWSPCLPFVSQFPERTQFLFIHLALQLSLVVLWFDFHVFWVQSPLPWLKQVVSQPTSQLPYHNDCLRNCHSSAPDIFAVDDFYSAYWSKPSIILFRPTLASLKWVYLLLHWICTYPYGNAKRGFQYLLHPDMLDAVPSLSMLPDTKGVQAAAPIRRGELDAEQKFVSTDGWFGRVEDVVSFEIGFYIAEHERVMFLDQLYSGSVEQILKIVYTAQKHSSPLRPNQRLLTSAVQDHADVTKSEQCTWKYVQGAFLGGFAKDEEQAYDSPQIAQCQCLALGPECRGVTCEMQEGKLEDAGVACTLRRGDPWLTYSPVNENTYVKICESGGCDAPDILRIVHVNYADGCCETEQQQSHDTALMFGADESRALRGDFLDEEFKVKNHALLTFNRTPELTQHKTPSGKIGYYVWKAYVVLKTLEDPTLPWDTTVVAWTDAGIHFVSDMRPLIQKYLRASDVAATRTPMLEGDFSKRDAFLLLDADYQTIIETNQVATGFILVRKTQLAVNFLRQWLRACEDPRIMTEEPSVLGAPDYFTFKNNNDDQTAFSLIFKKHGFHPFSVGERDAVVYTGRNLAKFIKASDDFAVGRESTREDYLKAADEAAKKT